jgi:transcriptional antiterminator RfaH
MLNIDGPSRPLAWSERWYLVHAQPRSEQKAEFNLRAQDFRTFVPWLLKTVRHVRKLRTVRAPVFPGYVFVSLDLERDRWLSVRSTIGVLRLISHRDGRPVPVPAGIVERLLEQSDGNLTRLDLRLIKGQSVRILAGPFADFVGTLERLDEAGRVQVLLDLMGTSVPVSLNRSLLAPAA